jgi:hypothetical protein
MPRIYAPEEDAKQAQGEIVFVNGVAALPAGTDTTAWSAAGYTVDTRQHTLQPLDKLSIADLWLMCDQLGIDLSLAPEEIPTRAAMVPLIDAAVATALDAITVSCAQGTECGDTTVSISSDQGGDLVYSVSVAAYTPVWYEDLSHLDKIEDGDDVTATNGYYVNVFELDARGRCIGYGSAQAVSATNDDIELAKILDNSIKALDWWYDEIEYTENNKTEVEYALLTNAQALVAKDYVVAIEDGSTYDTGTAAWTGKFTVTCPDGTHSATDAVDRAITVTFTAIPAIAELAKVTDNGIKTLPNATLNTKAAVDAAVLVLANTLVGEGYTATISGTATYNTTTRAWVGKICVTADADENDTATDANNRTLAIVPTTVSSDTELAKITDVSIETLPNTTLNVKSGAGGVEEAMLALATAGISEGYTVSIESGSTYDTATRVWTGKFRVSTDARPLDFTIDASARSLDILATGASAATELAKIADGDVDNLPIGTEDTKVGVEGAMLVLAQAKVGAGFTVSIVDGSTYDIDTNNWVGKFKVTSDTHPLDFVSDAANREITVTIATE